MTNDTLMDSELERWTCEHSKKWFLSTDAPDKKKFVWNEVHADTDSRTCDPDIDSVAVEKIEEELF